jgi:hypothetical protein
MPEVVRPGLLTGNDPGQAAPILTDSGVINLVQG